MGHLKNSEELSVHAHGSESIEALENIHSSADAARISFLSSFSPEEDKAIRRKVDWRFLWLIGLMYIIKNVSSMIITVQL